MGVLSYVNTDYSTHIIATLCLPFRAIESMVYWEKKGCWDFPGMLTTRLLCDSGLGVKTMLEK